MALTLDDLPETIKLGPHEIKIKVDPELALREDRWGMADHRYNEIILAGTIPGGRALAETLIHEVLHHIGHIYGAPPEFQDHAIVGRLDLGLLDFLVNNQELIRRLIEA